MWILSGLIGVLGTRVCQSLEHSNGPSARMEELLPWRERNMVAEIIDLQVDFIQDSKSPKCDGLRMF